MENRELEKRIQELADRCERTGSLTQTGFLTPAEQAEVTAWARTQPEVRLHLSGGSPACERQAAFFLPFYMESEDFDPAEYIKAVCVRAYYATPTHRDYMGAALGLGIRRDRLGDIWVQDDRAYIFCLPPVEELLARELTKAGRCSVKTAPCPLGDIPQPERTVKTLRFTVKSLRLDAVAGHMFGLSRTEAAELIRLGGASLNYIPCTKGDAPVKEGDVLSLRGHGKGTLTAIGSRTKKDRIFLEAELLQ